MLFARKEDRIDVLWDDQPGSANNDGVIFSVPITGGVPTVLASFSGPDGANPHGTLTLSADGSTLYGMTYSGGNLSLDGGLGAGTMFALALVPEPSSFVLFALGGIGSGMLALRRRAQSKSANASAPWASPHRAWGIADVQAQPLADPYSDARRLVSGTQHRNNTSAF